MSEISKAITTLTVQPIEALSDQSTWELQNIQVAYRLNEKKNNLQWSQVVKMFLKGKGKLCHLFSTRPKQSDPKIPELGRGQFHDYVMAVEFDAT